MSTRPLRPLVASDQLTMLMTNIKGCDASGLNILCGVNLVAQLFETYMKVKSYTGAVVISSLWKHIILTYIKVSHKFEAMDYIISQFHS